MSPSTEPISDSKAAIMRELNQREASATILVIGGPTGLSATITEQLDRAGYDVHRLPRPTADMLTRLEPLLVLVATELSGMENARICSQIRLVSTVPIVVLSAHQEETDKVLALELGADGYLVTPVGEREFLATVRAQLRRAQIGRSESVGMQRVGTMTIDRVGRRVCLNETELHLSPKEFDLLTFLLKEPGRAFTREQLLREVWGYRYYGGIKTVDVHVRWLREKLSPYEPLAFRITTLRGIGYRLDLL